MIGFGILVALGVAVVMTGLDFIRTGGLSNYRNDDWEFTYSIGAGVASFILGAVTNCLVLYMAMPARNGIMGGQSWVWVNVLIALVCFGAVGLYSSAFSASHGLALLFFIVFGISGIVVGCSPGGDEDAKTVSHVLKVVFPGASKEYTDATKSEHAKLDKNSDEKLFPSSNPSHIPLVTSEMATTKVKQQMASGSHKFQGSNIESIFQAGNATIQKVQNHLWWIVELDFVGRRESNAVHNEIPGYFAVDAESPDGQVVYKDGFKLVYVPSGLMDKRLQRHIYESYPNYNQDDPTLEVDESWKPYYTLTLNQPVLNTVTAPKFALVVHPDTGKLDRYSLGDNSIPSWIDRVYSAETVKDLLNAWGRWADAPRQLTNESTVNRYQVSGEPEVVYTDGDRADFQVLMTSMNSDKSASRVLLVDARTGVAELYQPASSVTIEDDVKSVMKEVQDNAASKYDPVGPKLYKINGVLTWVVSYKATGSDTFAAVGLMKASDSKPSSVAFATNFPDALDRYGLKLAESEVKNGVNQDSKESTKEATVTSATSYVKGGNTYYVFTFEGDKRAYTTSVLEDIGQKPLIKAGDHVRISVLDFGKDQNAILKSISLVDGPVVAAVPGA